MQDFPLSVTLQCKINKLTNNLTSVPSCGKKLCFLRTKRKVGRECVLTFLMWFLDEFQVSSAGNYLSLLPFTAPFNNMRTQKFKAQPTNGFFAAVNQVFGGSS